MSTRENEMRKASSRFKAEEKTNEIVYKSLN